MIQADALELQTMLRQTVIHIRQKEVELFTDQFGVLASISTFLGTLGFGGLFMSTNFLERGHGSHEFCSDLKGCNQRDLGDGERMPGLEQGFYFNNEVIITLFYGLITLSIMCHFAVVFVSFYCLVFGPELAIRGAESEQKRAIKGMYEERTFALQVFWVGCALILLSGAALGWLKYPLDSAIIVTALFASLLLFSVYYVYAFLTPLFEYVDAEGLDCSHLQGHANDDDAVVNTRRGPFRDFFTHLFQSSEDDHHRHLLYGGGGGGGGYGKKQKSSSRLAASPPPLDLTAAQESKEDLDAAMDEAKTNLLLDDHHQGGTSTAQGGRRFGKRSALIASPSPSSVWSNTLGDSFRNMLSDTGLTQAPAAPAPAKKVVEYASVKTAPLTVDGVPRYGLLADGRLRIFALDDGAILHDLDLASWTLHLDPKNHEGTWFVLNKKQPPSVPPKKDDPAPAKPTKGVYLAGADFDDTQHWIRAIVNNISGGGDRDEFDDEGDDDDALGTRPATSGARGRSLVRRG